MPKYSPVRGTKAEHPLSHMTDRERQFALHVAEGKTATVAAKLAGFETTHYGAQRFLNRKGMPEAIKHLQAKWEKSVHMDRQRVLEGFLEAIEQAKLMADPGVQIAGWREIGRMCGYYAPEVKEVNVTLSAKRTISQLETLPDDKLLELIEKDRAIIEGEATEIIVAEDLKNSKAEESENAEGILGSTDASDPVREFSESEQ